MKYQLLHNAKDYDSLKSNFDKLKEEFPYDFYLDEIYSRKLEKFDKIEESDKIKKEIVVSAIFSLIPCIGFVIYSNTLLKRIGFLLVENVC